MQLIIDAKRLLCPMPVIRLQDAAKKMPAGTEILIHCTDPGVKHDIPAWCRVHHHELLSSEEDKEGKLFLWIDTHFMKS